MGAIAPVLQGWAGFLANAQVLAMACRQAGQHHQRHRMPRQPLAHPFGCLLRAHLTHHQGVKANDDGADWVG